MSPTVQEMSDGGTLDALVRLRDEGKLRFIGISGILPNLPNLPDHIEMGVFDVFQIPYSALQRDHEDLISRAADTGAGVLHPALHAQSPRLAIE